jgi:hypothetical protein
MSRLLGVLIGLIATSAWLGLAVWGGGGFSLFFANPVHTALVAVTFALMLASVFTSGNLSPGEKEDRGNRWVLWAFLVVGLLDGWLPAYSARMGLWTFAPEAGGWSLISIEASG